MGVSFSSKLNRPMRRRNMYILLVLILLIEIALFVWSYLSNTNTWKVITGNLPLKAGAPTFIANIYGPLGDPLNKPMAVAVVNKMIYIADTNNQRVQVFDYDGNSVTMFGSAGEGEGQFRFPYGIAGDEQGQIYVADLYNAKISVFSPDGQFIKYFGGEEDFERPAGLAIDGNMLYVSDVNKSQILVYTLDGTQKKTIGEMGAGDGQLNSPNAVFHVGDKIYVSDTGNDRIVVFDDDGNFLMKASEELANPRGIAVDPQDNIYVVSNLTNKVVVFNQEGERLFSFGGIGPEDGQLRFPNGLTRDGQGRFYITDVGNARVSIFQ